MFLPRMGRDIPYLGLGRVWYTLAGPTMHRTPAGRHLSRLGRAGIGPMSPQHRLPSLFSQNCSKPRLGRRCPSLLVASPASEWTKTPASASTESTTGSCAAATQNKRESLASPMLLSIDQGMTHVLGPDVSLPRHDTSSSPWRNRGTLCMGWPDHPAS